MRKILRKVVRPMDKKESGNIIDYLGTILIMAFVFAMIVAYAAYGRVVQMRLAIDNTTKEYLYRMEEYGYILLDSGAPAAGTSGYVPTETQLKEDFALLGVDAEIDTSKTTTTQVGYGDKVTLALHTEYANPLFVAFGRDNSQFHIFGFAERLAYDVSMSSTSKW